MQTSLRISLLICCLGRCLLAKLFLGVIQVRIQLLDILVQSPQVLIARSQQVTHMLQLAGA